MSTLTRFRVADFKSFRKDTGGALIELAPITLIYGYNNTGKSALLRSLHWWRSSLQNSIEQPVNFDCPSLFGAGFESLMSHGSGSPVQIECSFALPGGAKLDLSWKIRNLSEKYTHVVEQLTATEDHLGQLNILWEPSNRPESASEYRITNDSSSQLIDCHFFGLLPSFSAKDHPALAKWSELLAGLKPQSIEWITSQRATTPRAFELLGHPSLIDQFGNGFAQWLAWSDRKGVKNNLVSKVSRWFEDTLSLSLSVTPEGKLFELTIAPKDQPGRRVNIVDSGQGLQELAPVLTLIHNSPEDNSIVCIEEPESHLHPRLHASLGEELVRATQDYPNRKYVLETHSENLLLSLQIAIAEKRLKNSDLVAHWVAKDDKGNSTVQRVSFDDAGRRIGIWPRDVFSADAEQARKLLQLQGKLDFPVQ